MPSAKQARQSDKSEGGVWPHGLMGVFNKGGKKREPMGIGQ